MTVFELIDKANKCEIDNRKVAIVENEYGPIYNDFAKRLISVELDDGMLYDFYGDKWQVRVMSPLEMIGSKDFIDEAYEDKELIPFISWGDLDILCYDTEEDEWVDLETESMEIVQSEVDFIDVAKTLHDGLPDIK